MRVLIGYATAHGSTRGIAERIAAGLRSRGHDVLLGALGPSVDLAGCDAVVLGSAIHDGRWLPEAAEFLKRHATALTHRRVWLFSVSLLGEQTSAFRPGVAKRLRTMRRKKGSEQLAGFRSAVHPLGHHDFAGAVAPDHWPTTGRVVFRAMGGRYGDYRDQAEIDAWTDEIAHSLPGGESADPPWNTRRADGR